MSTREAVHRDPVWRQRSNFIIGARLDPGRTDVTTEQLWARKIDDRHFQLCCIPFFVHDMALGDVVEVDADYLVQRVTAASGRYVFRVFFEGRNYGYRDSAVDALKALGGLIEWSSPSMFAVDARDRLHAQEIANLLHNQERQGRLIYETGKTA